MGFFSKMAMHRASIRMFVCTTLPNQNYFLQYNFMGPKGQGQASATLDEIVISSPTAKAANASLPKSFDCLISTYNVAIWNFCIPKRLRDAHGLMAPAERLHALMLAESIISTYGEGWLINHRSTSDAQDSPSNDIFSYLAEAHLPCKEKVQELLGYMLSVQGEDEQSPFYYVCFLLPMLCQITMKVEGCKLLASCGGLNATREPSSCSPHPHHFVVFMNVILLKRILEWISSYVLWHPVYFSMSITFIHKNFSIDFSSELHDSLKQVKIRGLGNANNLWLHYNGGNQFVTIQFTLGEKDVKERKKDLQAKEVELKRREQVP
ncbi:hypothetical protein K1719_034698 [Acacia pycnantha]|nr:hypothetical protein K1719_034698 [Acacia pycnantha]